MIEFTFACVLTEHFTNILFNFKMQSESNVLIVFLHLRDHVEFVYV